MFDLHDEVVKKHGKFFCAAPFNSLHEGPNGLVSTCCKTREPIGWSDKQTFEEMYNSEHAKSVRKDFIEGKKPKQCHECWLQEDTGQAAKNRITSNSHGYNTIDELVAATESDGYLPIHKPEWLDLLWTSKCNFACIGCGPELSSTINIKYKKAYEILNNQRPGKYNDTPVWNNSNKNKIDYIIKHSDTLTSIHLNGGEPFMQDDIFELLEEMIKRGLHKKIRLWSHTNGSVPHTYKGKDIVLDYLAHWGNKAKIIMSNDGFGPRGEYVRWGYKDKKWLETYDKIKDTDIVLTIQTCYNVFNALTINEIAEWYHDNCGENIRGSLSLWLNPTTSARMLNADLETKEKAIKSLEAVIDKKMFPEAWIKDAPSHLSWIQKDVKIDEWQKLSLRNGINALDEARGTNFLETFPELTQFYDKLSSMGT